MFGKNTKPGVGSAQKTKKYNTETMKNGRLERVQRAVASTPLKYRESYRRALFGESSPKAAIHSACRECVGFEDLPDAVISCVSYSCPLWLHRPGGGKTESLED